MIPCEDESAFSWISEGRSTRIGKYDDPDWRGNPVSLVVPPIFERYVKVLHSLDAHYENIDNPLSPEELSLLRIPECSSLRNLVEQHRSNPTPRIRWKTVADALGLAFESGITDDWFRSVIEPGCWPRFIYGPGDGWLDPEEGRALVSILKRHVTNPKIYLRMAKIPLITTETPLMYMGAMEDVIALLDAERGNMLPEYWWPPDHSWCVCSDYDLTYTLVGASDQVCQELLEDDVLECIEVNPETRIDYRSPPQTIR
jgi:hypothetical protein